jgi:hypothetical protein
MPVSSQPPYPTPPLVGDSLNSCGDPSVRCSARRPGGARTYITDCADCQQASSTLETNGHGGLTWYRSKTAASIATEVVEFPILGRRHGRAVGANGHPLDVDMWSRTELRGQGPICTALSRYAGGEGVGRGMQWRSVAPKERGLVVALAMNGRG